MFKVVEVVGEIILVLAFPACKCSILHTNPNVYKHQQWHCQCCPVPLSPESNFYHPSMNSWAFQ